MGQPLSSAQGEDTGTWPYIRIPSGTPPIFLVHAFDDPESGPEHSVAMFLALKRARIPTEMHVYSSGGHGFGVRDNGRPVAGWTQNYIAWLRDLGILSHTR